jgi:hypothetical protein
VADWRRHLPLTWLLAWSLLLATLMLGPALTPGYVLSYDMVWVPDLALRPDFWGLGSGLPRAVPSDAVVSVLDELVPGMVLQKLVLVGTLVVAGLGAARLTDQRSLSAQLVAVTVYQWNPFVAERLLIGHWPVLVAYATLPWVILTAARWRTTGRLPPGLWCLLPLGSLSASAGLLTAVALLAFGTTRTLRGVVQPSALAVAANAPWLVAGLLHAASAVTDPTGAEVFAARGEGSMPVPVAALTLGGIWNSEVVPPSRTGWAGWAALVLTVALVALGRRRWSQRSGRRDVSAYVGCWVVGLGCAVLSWAAPEQAAWVVTNVPGAGVLRDGARLLALCAPVLAAVAGYGAGRVAAAVAAPARPATIIALLLAPIAVLPDVAFGLSGRLSANDFPSDYARAREVVARSAEEAGAGPALERGAGDVLLLPLSSYRQPEWNDHHKVLNPIGRFLDRDVVAGDDLYVSGVQVAGEDSRVRDAATALALPSPGRRSAGLAALGIGYVVTESGAGTAPTVAGETLLSGPDLLVQSLGDPVASQVPLTWRVAMTFAWVAFTGLFLVGAAATVRAARPRSGAGGRVRPPLLQ